MKRHHVLIVRRMFDRSTTRSQGGILTETLVELPTVKSEADAISNDRLEGRNIGVLASGRGSNLQSIIDSIDRGELDASIAVVICNNPGALAIERARDRGIPCRVIDHRSFTKEGFMDAIDAALVEFEVDLVVLAGFMKVLSPSFVGGWRWRIVNIHPSLLPSFPGAHAHRDALNHGVKFTGLTIHLVDESVDGGPIIFQYPVEVHEGDSEETLSGRVLIQEHIWYPKIIGWLLDGKVSVEGRIARVSK